MSSENLRKRVMMFYGLALLSLIVTVPLSFMYNPIMQMAAAGVAFFIGFLVFLSLLSAYARTIFDLYEERQYQSGWHYAGTIDPSAFGIVSGIISFIIVGFSFSGIVDWEYLGLTMPNIFTIFWAFTGVCAFIGGIVARPLTKRKGRIDYRKDTMP